MTKYYNKIKFIKRMIIRSSYSVHSPPPIKIPSVIFNPKKLILNQLTPKEKLKVAQSFGPPGIKEQKRKQSLQQQTLAENKLFMINKKSFDYRYVNEEPSDLVTKDNLIARQEIKQFLEQQTEKKIPLRIPKLELKNLPPKSLLTPTSQMNSAKTTQPTNRVMKGFSCFSSKNEEPCNSRETAAISQAGHWYKAYELLKSDISKGKLTTRFTKEQLSPKILVGKRSKKHKFEKDIGKLNTKDKNFKLIMMNYMLNSPDYYDNKMAAFKSLQECCDSDELYQFIQKIKIIYNKRMRK